MRAEYRALLVGVERVGGVVGCAVACGAQALTPNINTSKKPGNVFFIKVSSVNH